MSNFISEKGINRFHTTYADIIIFLSLSCKAGRSILNLQQPNSKTTFELPSTIFKNYVRFEVHVDQILDSAKKNISPEFFKFDIKPGANLPFQNIGLASIFSNAFCAYIAFGLEPYVDWFRINTGSDYHKWPASANFSRIIRNAMVHGRTINIDSPSSPKVNWRGIEYSHIQKGRNIFMDLNFGDLLILLNDFNQDLELKNCPILI
jgi:hypothetical protein